MTRHVLIIMFGTRLQQIRKLRGHTQESVGAMIGATKQQVYRWERGETDPMGEQLVKLAKVLEVSIDYRMGLVDEPNGQVITHDLSPTERQLNANSSTCYAPGRRLKRLKWRWLWRKVRHNKPSNGVLLA